MLAEIVGLKGASSLPDWKRSSKLRGSEVHKTAGLKNASVCRAVKGGRLSPDRWSPTGWNAGRMTVRNLGLGGNA